MKFILLSFVFLTGCAFQQSVYETQIYERKYLNDTKRTEDSLFVISEVHKYGSLKNASKHYSDYGWGYLNSTNIGWSIPLYQFFNNPGKYNSALTMFNNAWLIDSSNSEAYWGVAAIVASREKDFKYAAKLMEKAVEFDSSSANLWFDYGLSNVDVLDNVPKLDSLQYLLYRNKAIKAFKKVNAAIGHPELKDRSNGYLVKLQSK